MDNVAKLWMADIISETTYTNGAASITTANAGKVVCFLDNCLHRVLFEEAIIGVTKDIFIDVNTVRLANDDACFLNPKQITCDTTPLDDDTKKQLVVQYPHILQYDDEFSVELRSIPRYVGPGHDVYVKGLVTCIGVIVEHYTPAGVIDGVIGGHFVTHEMAEEVNHTTYTGKLTEKGQDFVESIKDLMKTHTWIFGDDCKLFIYYSNCGDCRDYHHKTKEVMETVGKSLTSNFEIISVQNAKQKIVIPEEESKENYEIHTDKRSSMMEGDEVKEGAPCKTIKECKPYQICRDEHCLTPPYVSGETSFWPKHSVTVGLKNVLQWMVKDEEAEDCKRIIRELGRTKQHVPWVTLNTVLNPPGYDLLLWNDAFKGRPETYSDIRDLELWGDPGDPVEEQGAYLVLRHGGGRLNIPSFFPSISPTICRDTKGDLVKACVEFYRKCQWLDYLTNVSSTSAYTLLSEMPTIFGDYRPIVLKAVSKEGISMETPLSFASERLQNDKEVVLKAVQQDGNAIAYASPQLRADEDVVLTAVRHRAFESAAFESAGPLRHVDPGLRDKKDIVLAALATHPRAYKYVSDRLRPHLDVRAVAGIRGEQAFRDEWDMYDFPYGHPEYSAEGW